MFYVVVDEQGFCYIPTVTVTDQQGVDDVSAEIIAQPKINKATVSEMVDRVQAIQATSLEHALDLAEEIYKKLPRYRRQFGFDIVTQDIPYVERYGMTVCGAGTILAEISDKYL